MLHTEIITMLKKAILLLCVFLPDSRQQCFSPNDAVTFTTQEQYGEWVQSHRSFSVSLLKTLNSESGKKNLIFSPSSIQDILLLAYFGATRDTEEALAHVLQISHSQRKPVNWNIYNAERKLYTGSSSQLKTATRIFLSNKLKLRKCLAQKLRNRLELLDYGQGVEGAQSHINNWVARQTDGQITDLIQNLSPAATAIMVSAVYLKAKWANEFDPEHTQLAPFYVNSRERRAIRMMVKADSFFTGYSKDLQARFLVLPYERNTTAMIILLPNEDLDTMINSMTEGSLRTITAPKNYNTSYFQIVIPKYEHKSSLDLTATLEKLGIGDTFTEHADFSGFTGRKEVFFNGVVHKAKIEVDEEGTRATAATGGITSHSAKIPSKPFICDHPFAYIIYDYSSSKILFMGTFREPTGE